MAAKLGLDVGINYKDKDFGQVVEERTGGAGVNVVFDMVGGPYWERNLASLSLKGRMVLFGLIGGNKVEADLGNFFPKRLQVHGTVSGRRPMEEKIELTHQFKRHVLPLIVDGRIEPVIDRTFPLEKVTEAHEYMETNANFGKIILTMD